MANEFYGIDEFPSVVRTEKIEITYCEAFDEKSDIWCFDLHNHPSVIEMIFFRSGKGEIAMASNVYAISYYDLIIYPAGMFHKETLVLSEHQDIICIRIRIGNGLNFNAPIHIKDRKQTLCWLFNHIFDEYNHNSIFLNLAEDYVRLMLLECYNFCLETVQNYNFVETAIAYINDHFSDPLSLTEIAKVVHVAPSHLGRCFKKQTGLSVINYLLLLRIDTAKHMLCTTSYSVEMISEATGFNSPKYFNRVFKKYTGKSPSEFRNYNGRK